MEHISYSQLFIEINIMLVNSFLIYLHKKFCTVLSLTISGEIVVPTIIICLLYKDFRHFSVTILLYMYFISSQ